jgi:anti-sigma factor RsiW
MTRCSDCEDFLVDYVELSQQDRDKVDRHVSECESCRELLIVLSEINTRLTSEYSSVALHSGFRNDVRERIVEHAPLEKPSLIPEILDAIGWTSLAAIALALVWVVLPSFGPSEAEFAPSNWTLLLLSAAALFYAIKFGLRVRSELLS